MTPSRPAPNVRPVVSELAARGRVQALVIGGGINGIATFRDLALQGVDVVLVERADFASGATAASSHMIHGGIRYLENGEFRLVKESVEERNGLLRIAPHFVKPLETTIPIYSTFRGILQAPLRFLTHKQGKPTERGALLIKVGLTIYDIFSRDGGTVPRHRFHGRKRSLEALPVLDPKIRYTATYFDASVHDPERLALDVLLDGCAAEPRATAANYVEAIGLDGDTVTLRDTVTGETFTLAADVVVNASGPWSDLTNEALGRPSQFMGGTKGSHIVLDNEELLEATKGREIFFEHEDGRIVLIYPIKGRVLVGTTDIDADPSQPALCTEEEIDYFFDLIHHVFPTIAVDREQIVFRYSGIRPLPRHEDTAPGFVSRDYRVEIAKREGAAPVVTLVGGKWTTFRALGESLANTVLGLLGAERRVSTSKLAIGGGVDFPATAEAAAAWMRTHLAEVPAGRHAQLLERYGTRARAVVAFLSAGEDREILGGRLSTRELAWMVENEQAVHLTDVLLRRTDLAFTGALSDDVLIEIADALAEAAGWDADTLSAELADARTELAARFGVELAPALAD